MKRFLVLALLALVGVAAYAVSPSSTAIVQYPDSTGTNMVFQVNSDGTVLSDGTITTAGGTVVLAANATYTATVAKAASAIQPTTATYTATVAKAASALQPGSVGSAATNAASNGLVVTIGGTNYIIQLYPN